jgi:glutamate synthase domain-containing protein 1
MPRIRQFFVGRRGGDGMDFERKLYVIRRRLHKETEGSPGCYVVSLSSKTVIYKGLLKGRQLDRFYADLRDPNFASAISLVHERFSTNTLGSWELAHPYRFIAHNGEINTIRGNVNWMRARAGCARSFSGRTSASSPPSSCRARATRPPSTTPSSSCTWRGAPCRTRWP